MAIGGLEELLTISMYPIGSGCCVNSHSIAGTIIYRGVCVIAKFAICLEIL